ncbi:hypothetical protein [Saccharothrix deserti]|uniref:hypothetical protein n=1 Tax=Saccharothrix deserti TaxID=2593674 RepID=UPI00131ECB83|nr:hypothetical protein [Saccharothrix deserti]
MRSVITVTHAPLMRSRSVLKPVVAAALGCLILTGCGAQKVAADQTPAGSVMSANLTADDTEVRFLELSTRIAQGCAPDAPDSGNSAPRPEDLPGGSQAGSPRYPAGSTPPGTPDANGDIPIPVDSPAEPTPDSTLPVEVKEVALNGIETCAGEEHIALISNAFEGTGAAGYQQMADKLTALGYPAARIYQMPEHSGSLHARLDLRTMGSRLALEVTAAGSGVVAEAFGVPEREDVNVTQVQRTPNP